MDPLSACDKDDAPGPGTEPAVAPAKGESVPEGTSDRPCRVPVVWLGAGEPEIDSASLAVFAALDGEPAIDSCIDGDVPLGMGFARAEPEGLLLWSGMIWSGLEGRTMV